MGVIILLFIESKNNVAKAIIKLVFALELSTILLLKHKGQQNNEVYPLHLLLCTGGMAKNAE